MGEPETTMAGERNDAVSDLVDVESMGDLTAPELADHARLVVLRAMPQAPEAVQRRYACKIFVALHAMVVSMRAAAV